MAVHFRGHNERENQTEEEFMGQMFNIYSRVIKFGWTKS